VAARAAEILFLAVASAMLSLLTAGSDVVKEKRPVVDRPLLRDSSQSRSWDGSPHQSMVVAQLSPTAGRHESTITARERVSQDLGRTGRCN
jgi:hypothetical protein